MTGKIWKQCEFWDKEGEKHYGLINPDTHEIICSCCGNTFDEQVEVGSCRIYNDWVDFGYAIRD